MTTENEKQYRAVTIIETRPQNALTVRYYRDMISNILNTKAHVSNHKIIQDNYSESNEMESWSEAQDTFGTGNVKFDEEHVRMVYAPRYIPDGYSRLLVQSMHLRTQGSGETTWRLRVMKKFNDLEYVVGNTRAKWWGFYNTNSWCRYEPDHHPDVRTAEWTTNSGTMSLSSMIVKTSVRDRRNRVNIVLTSQNTTIDTVSNLYSLDVTPLLGE